MARHRSRAAVVAPYLSGLLGIGFARGPDMNAYTARGQARIRRSDLANLQQTDPSLVGPSLRALEWRRGCQAEAELDWLLKQHGVRPQSAKSPVSMLRQAIGAALIWAGERLGGAPHKDEAPEAVSAASTLGTAG